jgi:hypothetical protein
MVSRRLADEAAGETVAPRARFTDKLEDELMVTRICDSILGRLNEVKARDDRESRKGRLRRRIR